MMNDLIAFSEKFKRLRDLLILYCGWSFRRGYIIILNLWTIYIYLGTGLYISCCVFLKRIYLNLVSSSFQVGFNAARIQHSIHPLCL